MNINRLTVRRWSVRLAIMLLILATVFPLAGAVGAAPEPQADFHIVRPGDTWQSIAAQYAVPVQTLWQANGVVNPSQLAEGQRLFIPSSGLTVQSGVLSYQIEPDELPVRAALDSGNSLPALMLLNGFASPAAAFGQQLSAPNRRGALGAVAEATPATQQPTPEPEEEEEEPQPEETEGALARSKLGIQGHYLIDDDERTQLLDRAAYDLEFGWVKQQIRWDEFEYAQDRYSDVMVETLDLFMDDAQNRDLKILLSVVAAPDWARSTTEEDGPPINYEDYNDFIKWIVLRYKTKLTAIEIWNEPNLGREWRGGTLSGGEYVQLLAGAYNTVKSEYPEGNILVISAGLAPTGVNDGVNAIDDRVFLRQMYDAGVANYADAIGIHPYSWGNPPWTRCCGNWGGAPSHNDHPSFFFLDTIEDYREIQTAYNDAGRQLWATEFGWGTMDGLNRATPENAPYFDYLNAQLQAEYIVEAFRMGQGWDFMGPMFLWNLNIASVPNLDMNQSGYSILIDVEHPRPAFDALADIPKVDR
jgi:LysM repeat protein